MSKNNGTTGLAKYRRRDDVYAIRYTGDNYPSVVAAFPKLGITARDAWLTIHTITGSYSVPPDTWIVRDNGNFLVYNDTQFHEMYARVEDSK